MPQGSLACVPAWHEPSFLGTRRGTCGDVCFQGVDAQQFCRSACQAPVVGPHRAERTHGRAHCQPVIAAESSVRKGSGGSKFIQESAVHVGALEHYSLTKASGAAAETGQAASVAGAPGPAAWTPPPLMGKPMATPVPPVTSPWVSIKDPVPEDVANVMKTAKTAEASARETVKFAKAVKELRGSAMVAAPASTVAAEKAREESMSTLGALGITSRYLEAVRQAVREVAESVIQPTLDEAIKQARAKAQKEAEPVAQKALAAQGPRGKAAAAKAMVPYMDALGRAVATAGVYASRGDNLVGASSGLQMDAQMVFNEANQFMSLGDNARAEKLRQQAMQMMNVAVSLNGAANSNYGNADAIMKTPGQYAAEAGAAAYHAEVMENPDAPPPPPPLVS